MVGDVKPRKSRDGEGAYAAILIKSMGCFLHAYPNADDDRIVAQLKPCHPAEILANIKLKHKTEGGTSEVNGAICIRTKYNSRLQSDRVLPLDKLVR